MIEREGTFILLSFYTRVATTWMYLLLLLLQFVVIVLASLIIPKVCLFFHKNLIAMRMHCSMQPNIESLYIKTTRGRINNYTSIYWYAFVHLYQDNICIWNVTNKCNLLQKGYIIIRFGHPGFDRIQICNSYYDQYACCFVYYVLQLSSRSFGLSLSSFSLDLCVSRKLFT